MREETRLKRALETIGRGRGSRYPGELKERVVAFAAGRRQSGVTWETVSEELGLGLDTVRRWCVGLAGKRRSRALVPVRVTERQDTARLVSVVSPAGFRIDGLTLPEAVVALRELG